MLKFESKNGYIGMLYGENSLKVVNFKGEEVFKTSQSPIKTMAELTEFVDNFPKQRKSLLRLYKELSE